MQKINFKNKKILFSLSQPKYLWIVWAGIPVVSINFFAARPVGARRAIFCSLIWYISINNLTVSFGGYNLFSDINFHISDNDRIGLVGKNGAGKSTLLKLIAGKLTPTSGEVEITDKTEIAYYAQELELLDEEKSILDNFYDKEKACFKAVTVIDEINQQINRYEEYRAKHIVYEDGKN